jgi:hypothetical protein
MEPIIIIPGILCLHQANSEISQSQFIDRFASHPVSIRIKLGLSQKNPFGLLFGPLLHSLNLLRLLAVIVFPMHFPGNNATVLHSAGG